jgi:hypothetical protein
MPPPVQYDFTAAEELVSALRYLHQKLTDLHELRSNRRHADLECPDLPGVSVPWRGQARGRFDTSFDGQQAQLRRLAAEANTLLKAVNRATGEAEHAHKKAHLPTG